MRGSKALKIFVASILAIALEFAIGGCGDGVPAPDPPSASSLIEKDALVALGYLDWTESEASSVVSGVTQYEPESVLPGYTLIASRTLPEAYLIDLRGRIVHAWSYPDDYWSGTGNRTLWEAPILEPGGDLLVIDKFNGILRLSWESKLVWRSSLAAHHEIEPAPDGGYYTLGMQVHKYLGLPVRFPTIAKLSNEGEVVSSWSSFQDLDKLARGLPNLAQLDARLRKVPESERKRAWRDYRLRSWLRVWPEAKTYDYLHGNRIEVIGRNAHADRQAFRPGNLLVCFRNLDQIATMDPNSHEILWSFGAGELERPHHPSMLASGNILVYDNGPWRKYSRVVEVDPIKGQIVWQYPSDPTDPRQRFLSYRSGSSDRLANGNTLIADSENGRIFEVTRSGRIVWEFYHPEINEAGQRATLYRATRYDKALVDRLIEGRGARVERAPAWGRPLLKASPPRASSSSSSSSS